MPVLAHIGHWYAEILYVLPVALMVMWLWLSSRREKRHAAPQGEDGPRATPDGVG